jgi:hypothetical protein
MENLLTLAGRLHLLLLHLPIGMLYLALLMHLYGRWSKTGLSGGVRFSLAAGALTAVLTAFLGWLLARGGGYEEALLDRHQWLGFAAAALAVASWWTYGKSYGFPVLLLATVVLALAGHAGGSLTHGEDFLWAPFQEKAEQATQGAVPIMEAGTPQPMFAGLVAPVLKRKCLSCHRTGKQKGDLNLETFAKLLKGGKNGSPVVPVKPGESLLIQRILLPLYAEEHMPPSGKPQLTQDEMNILQRWIELGADTLSMIPEDMAALLGPQPGKTTRTKNPVYDLQPAAPSAGALRKLTDLGIQYLLLGEKSPLIAVSIPADRTLDGKKMQTLQSLSEQIVHLDLSGSALTDELSNVLAELPHLARLNLSRTAVGDATLKRLSGLQYLEYLNISQTAVTDAGLQSLGKLSRLRNLYVWQTAVSPKGLRSLQKSLPALQMTGGAPDNPDQKLALLPPKIQYSRTFFEDTLQVAIDFPFESVGLYYTMDNSIPTTKSTRYKEPLLIQETATLKVIAAKEGWEPSPAAEASFIQRSKSPRKATLLKAPSPKYSAKGGESLFDGKISDAQGADTWLGYQGEHLTAVLDYGERQTFQNAYVHCLENNNPWIFKPAALKAWCSDDGIQFKPCGNRSMEQNTSMGMQQTYLLSLAFDQAVQARYIKIQVQSPLKNPVWHPSAGQPCWIFVDEVVVE